jgi:hypothetical protein
LLSNDPLKFAGYTKLHQDLQQLCWGKFEQLDAKKIPTATGWKFAPYKCVLSFDTDPNTYVVTNINLQIDPDSAVGSASNRLIISREIFTGNEGSKLEAVRDMHQLIHVAMSEYYKAVFPNENIGKVRLPRLLMD